MYHKKKPRKK
uniref:Uncharacterized protein n=1 Tax=Rhizophora mucronata TaxID=61149 RepID=A0A2P2NS29_RHIMU